MDLSFNWSIYSESEWQESLDLRDIGRKIKETIIESLSASFSGAVKTKALSQMYLITELKTGSKGMNRIFSPEKSYCYWEQNVAMGKTAYLRLFQVILLCNKCH